MTRAAYLRVYLPADVLAADELLQWESRPAPPVQKATMRASPYGLLTEPPGEDALITEWEGRRFVCPRHPRLRALEGVLGFHNAYPGSLLVPESVVRRAAIELEKLRRLPRRPRSHILTSPWHVPLRWFAAFAPQEREFCEEPTGPTIRYRTERGQASERLADTVRVLAEAGFEEQIVGEVEELAEWLGDFPLEALVELDYGSVAGLFSAADLALDESAADVQASLEALRRGDLEQAGEHYAEAAWRWAEAQAVTYCN